MALLHLIGGMATVSKLLLSHWAVEDDAVIEALKCHGDAVENL